MRLDIAHGTDRLIAIVNEDFKIPLNCFADHHSLHVLGFELCCRP